MALQSSGAISISQIRTELGSASGSLRTLSSLAGKSTPDAMSEFYGYTSRSEIYWSGSLSYSISGGRADRDVSVVFSEWDATSSSYINQGIFGFYGGDASWSIYTDATSGIQPYWDKYVYEFSDGYSSQMTFEAEHYFNNYSERATLAMTPPTGKSFDNWYTDLFNGSYTAYDVSASGYFVTYYIDKASFPSVELGRVYFYPDLI